MGAQEQATASDNEEARKAEAVWVSYVPARPQGKEKQLPVRENTLGGIGTYRTETFCEQSRAFSLLYHSVNVVDCATNRQRFVQLFLLCEPRMPASHERQDVFKHGVSARSYL